MVGAHCDQCGEATLEPRPLPEPATLVPRWDSQTAGTPVRPVRFSAPRPQLQVPDRTDEIDLRAIRRGSSASGSGPATGSPAPTEMGDDEETRPVPVASQIGASVRARLDGLWAEVLGTQVPTVAVVRGESGAGKSYAIDRFCASVPDARTLAIAGRGLAAGVELTGWASLLENLQVDPTKLALAPDIGAPMARAVRAALISLSRGELIGEGPEVEVPLAEGLAAALRASAADKACVIALDGEGTMTGPVVRALVRDNGVGGHARLLVLVEQRPGAPNLPPPPAVQEVVIPPLSSRALKALADQRAGEGPREALSTAVIEQLGGSARDVIQLIEALDPTSRPRDDQVKALASNPAQRRAALIDRMSPMVRSVAGRAAVLGDACTISELIHFCADVAGAEGVRAALATLTQWGVVEVVAAGVPIVRFCAAPLQADLLASLPAVQREHLVERARQLAQRPVEDDDVADTDKQLAAPPPLSAAASLIDASKLDEAGELLDQLEDAALLSNQFAKVAAVGTLRGQLALRRGDIALAKLTLEESLQMALQLGDRDAEASARAVLVRAHVRSGDLSAADDELERLANATDDNVWVGQLRGEVGLARKADAFLKR
jgi:hypothetical protein